MNKRRILNAFREAEIDWSKPLSEYYNNDTVCGLCLYFSRKGYNEKLFFELQKCWLKYATKNPNKHSYHFHSWGSSSIGRAERLDAIRKVIKDVESKSWWKFIF
jgi:hypothetical protein